MWMRVYIWAWYAAEFGVFASTPHSPNGQWLFGCRYAGAGWVQVRMWVWVRVRVSGCEYVAAAAADDALQPNVLGNIQFWVHREVTAGE